MTEIDKLLIDFFEAENSRNWKRYEGYLSDDVEWTVFGPPGRRVIKGKTQYLETMKKYYSSHGSKFDIIYIAMNKDKGIAMAELEMDSRRSVDIFEFRDGLIFREREYYDDSVWLKELQNEQSGRKIPRREFVDKPSLQNDLEQLNKISKKLIQESFSRAILVLNERVPSGVKWAVDGSTSLALQGVDVIPHDIDILTDGEGAYKIQEVLSDYTVRPISHTSTDRYDSHFGTFNIYGIKLEVMGDLKVFRDEKWSGVMNPSTVNIVKIDVGGVEVPVVSIEHQRSSGYLEEKYEKGEISKEEYDRMRKDLEK